jgi:hypothetical protein
MTEEGPLADPEKISKEEILFAAAEKNIYRTLPYTLTSKQNMMAANLKEHKKLAPQLSPNANQKYKTSSLLKFKI